MLAYTTSDNRTVKKLHTHQKKKKKKSESLWKTMPSGLCKEIIEWNENDALSSEENTKINKNTIWLNLYILMLYSELK